MKQCKKCKESFSTYIEIDGVHHNLCNREYCLKCSPYGEHNTRKLDGTRTNKDGTKCICLGCGRKYIYNRGNAVSTKSCNSCQTKKRRLRTKTHLIELKGGKCEQCGYDKNNAALVFHHLNPKEKDFGISHQWNKSLKRTLKELKKCILICANCHAELHNPNLMRPSC